MTSLQATLRKTSAKTDCDATKSVDVLDTDAHSLGDVEDSVRTTPPRKTTQRKKKTLRKQQQQQQPPLSGKDARGVRFNMRSRSCQDTIELGTLGFHQYNQDASEPETPLLESTDFAEVGDLSCDDTTDNCESSLDYSVTDIQCDIAEDASTRRTLTPETVKPYSKQCDSSNTASASVLSSSHTRLSKTLGAPMANGSVKSAILKSPLQYKALDNEAVHAKTGKLVFRDVILATCLTLIAIHAIAVYVVWRNTCVRLV